MSDGEKVVLMVGICFIALTGWLEFVLIPKIEKVIELLERMTNHE